LPELATRLRWAAAVAVVAAVVAPLALGSFTPMIGLGVLMAAWVLASTATALFERVRGWPAAQWPRRLRGQTGAWYGMLLAHAGVGVFIVGVTLVGGYQTEQDLRMEVGSTASIAGHDFTLRKLAQVRGPNYDAVRATFDVSRDGRTFATLTPEKRVYHASAMPMTEAGVDRGITRDLYVSLGEPLDEGRAWVVRLYVKPFVDWIWGGCVLMALGGVLAVADRRYRLRRAAAIALPAGLVTGA
jgi:cytochrome c-type biogenesis protein CcmF